MFNLRVVLAVILSLSALNGLTVSGKEARKPNIVFMLADDLGYADIGPFGQKKIRTPNLDRMAAEGMKFTQHYSGSPVCAPSRCVLMTGKHSGHAFIRNNRELKPEGQFPIPEGTQTITRLFQQNGYVTGAFGKWGLGGPESSGAPLQQGVDRFYGYNCQRLAHNLYPAYLWDNDQKVTLKNPEPLYSQRLAAGADLQDPTSYKGFIGKEYAPDLYTEQALKFIRDNKERPFFLYYPTIVPHLALQVPEDSLKEYLGKFGDVPYPGGNGYLPHRTPRAAYAAIITRMDREIGRMLNLVKELGLDEDTIFVFTSDNGPAVPGQGGVETEFFDSNGPLRDYKGSIHDGGIRVPLIVRWKGQIKAGSVSDRVTGFEDWMPTLTEMSNAKGKVPSDVDGISFAKVLMGKKMKERSFLYREFAAYGGQQSIRVGKWKAVRKDLKPEGNAAPNLHTALYDIEKDIAEAHDVSVENPKIVARLEKLMSEQRVPSKEFPFPALDEVAKK